MGKMKHKLSAYRIYTRERDGTRLQRSRKPKKKARYVDREEERASISTVESH